MANRALGLHCALFATRPQPLCCILSYNTRNDALTSVLNNLYKDV